MPWATGGGRYRPHENHSAFYHRVGAHFSVGLVTQADGAPHVHARSVATEFPDEVPGCVLGGERVPPHAIASTTRVTPHLFGIGLLENIPDTTLIQNGLSSAQANPEVSGRPGVMFPGGVNDPNAADQLVGRLGARGFVADVQSFTQGAFSTELGIATFHPCLPRRCAPKAIWPRPIAHPLWAKRLAFRKHRPRLISSAGWHHPKARAQRHCFARPAGV